MSFTATNMEIISADALTKKAQGRETVSSKTEIFFSISIADPVNLE